MVSEVGVMEDSDMDSEDGVGVVDMALVNWVMAVTDSEVGVTED
jgi:hypothetical protein